MVLSHKGL